MAVNQVQITASRMRLADEQDQLHALHADLIRRVVILSAELARIDPHAPTEWSQSGNIAVLDAADNQLTTMRTMFGQTRRRLRAIQKLQQQHERGVFIV